MRTATPDAVCAPPLEHCTLLYRATPYPSPSILPSSTAAPSPPTVSTPVLVESATAAALSFLPSFFPFFLPSLASRSASPSSQGPPCSPFIEQAWAAPPDSLYLTLSLFLGYTGCVSLSSSQTFRRPYAPSSGYHANPPSGSFEFRRLPRDSKMEESIFRGIGKID